MNDSGTAVHDPRPKSMDPSVITACQASIVLAAGLSITLNVYQHVHSHDLNPGIAWVVGTFVPVLVALLSHVAAHVKSTWLVKALVFGISGLLMYVSASAGTTVLTPALHFGPALATSVGADLAALTVLGFLMHAADLRAALEAWQEREAQRRRQAELDALDAQYGRPARQGNTLGNGRGNAPGNVKGNGQGNNRGLLAGNAGRPALPPAESTGTEAPGGRVVQMRRPVASPEEIRALARKLAAELDIRGRALSVAAYKERYGGKTDRIAPIVAEVKAEFAARCAAAGE